MRRFPPIGPWPNARLSTVWSGETRIGSDFVGLAFAPGWMPSGEADCSILGGIAIAVQPFMGQPRLAIIPRRLDAMILPRVTNETLPPGEGVSPGGPRLGSGAARLTGSTSVYHILGIGPMPRRLEHATCAKCDERIKPHARGIVAPIRLWFRACVFERRSSPVPPGWSS